MTILLYNDYFNSNLINIIKRISYFIKILIFYKLILLNIIMKNELNTSRNILK